MYNIEQLESYSGQSTTKRLSILKQPILSVINDHLIAYPTPSNLNYFWGFGSLASLSLVIQIVTGVFLACHYTPDVNLAFSSVEHIMTDVQGGFVLRYAHANGASMFFMVTFVHMLRSLYYASYQAPREAVWIIGVVILFLMIATAFMGGRTCAALVFQKSVLRSEGRRLGWARELPNESNRGRSHYMCQIAYPDSRPTTARITNLILPCNTGDRMPPAAGTTLLLPFYARRHPIALGISSGSSIVFQRGGVRSYRTQARQEPKEGALTVNATKQSGTCDMLPRGSRRGERVTAHVKVSRLNTALSCEGPQPGDFLGTAIMVALKVRNLDWNVFSVWELAKALAQIEYYGRLARQNLGFLGRVHIHKILGNQSFLTYALALTKPKVAIGIDHVVPRGLTSGALVRLAREIRNGKYSPMPTRRVMIPKAVKGKFRPIGVASSRDKVVQQALKVCLEPIFEPVFSNSSHGFRPQRSCHTALKAINRYWKNPIWLIEFDFASAYDTLNHRVLMRLINRRFRDPGLMKMIWGMLKAGYINPLNLVDSQLEMEEGTPQGSIISPLMANIYFNALDQWVEQHVVPHFSVKSGSNKGITDQYLTAVSRWRGNLWEGVLENVKGLTPSVNTIQRREILKGLRVVQARADNIQRTEKGDTILHYVRYADDFLLGFRGTKVQAKQIVQTILYFIENELRMQINVEKSGIWHKEDGVMFLGYKIWLDENITVRNSASESQRRTRTDLKFTIPLERLFRKYAAKGFFQKPTRGKTKRLVPRYQAKYVFMHPYHIIQNYNAVIRGLVNYYSGSERLSDLHKFLHELRRSAALTIAHYHKKGSAKAMFARYGRKLRVTIQNDKHERTVEYLAPNLSMRPPSSRWSTGQVNDVSRQTITAFSLPKTMAMVKSAKDLICAIPNCGEIAADWHPIKHQRKVGGSGVKRTALLSIARQIAVCKKHHILIHTGRYDGPNLRKLPAYER